MNLKKNPLNSIALSVRADDEPEELSAGVPSTYGVGFRQQSGARCVSS